LDDLLRCIGRDLEKRVGLAAVAGGGGDQVGETEFADRTLATLGVDDGRRGGAGREQGVQAPGGVLGLAAECGVEDDLAPPFGLDVKDGPGGDGRAELFLEGDGLGAELHVVVVPAAAFPALVLDGVENVRPTGGIGVELDEVGDADEPQAMTDDPQPASGTKGTFVAIARGVDAPMIERPGGGVDIIAPEALQAMKGAPARAEEQVVERRQRRVVVAGGCRQCRKLNHGITR
jgi:hypothetical protein